jgi:hypothetical protein
MSSINIKTNISQVTTNLQQKLKNIGNPESVLRPLCFDIIDLMTKRIHIDGVAADNQLIGTYSKQYLQLRIKKYNRFKDPKVVVSLTRQLENDWSVIATPKGYGVGFKNSFNLDKARWVEQIKDRIIFSLSETERQYTISFINDKTAETLNG